VSLHAVGRGLRDHDPGSGKIPQISLVLGAAAGGAAYGPALTDVVVLGPTAACSSPAPTWCVR
jgi:acetyl-CoA/propionyl-CoA carboxylase carboxyl transferase subunit